MYTVLAFDWRDGEKYMIDFRQDSFSAWPSFELGTSWIQTIEQNSIITMPLGLQILKSAWFIVTAIILGSHGVVIHCINLHCVFHVL
jgi:hypothetical protein